MEGELQAVGCGLQAPGSGTRNTVTLLTTILAAFTTVAVGPTDLADLKSVPPDLRTPPVTDGQPAPGKRVRQTHEPYRNTQIYHVLYLPADWRLDRRFPVIVEYPGNGPYRNQYGDVCSGKVDDCNLGYGISGGNGFIWVCLPFVNAREGRNQLQWWGDVDATVAYCNQTVRDVCENYGGDPHAVILTGFSRGAIACNYIGLHDDAIARLWRAFIAHSHYDGVRRWGYDEDDRPSALIRLRRLNGRPVFISQEVTVDDTRRYLADSGVKAPFTFQALPYRNHRDDWVLRDIPERNCLRKWLKQVLENSGSSPRDPTHVPPPPPNDPQHRSCLRPTSRTPS